MPYSYHYGKPEAIEFIQKNTSTESKILDVGPGVGTYADFLNPLGYKIDAIEIYDKYIDAYDLKNKYKNIYVDSIVKFDVSEYDFVILGDVLEHLDIEDALKVLNKCKNVLVAVPYICPQSGVDFYHNEHHLINPYEEHKQADLTPLVMLTRYPSLGLIWSNHLYGYYSNITWNGYYSK
jgi:SAM-dependent methyltransferase